MLEVAKLPFNENNSVSAVKSLKRAQEIFFLWRFLSSRLFTGHHRKDVSAMVV